MCDSGQGGGSGMWKPRSTVRPGRRAGSVVRWPGWPGRGSPVPGNPFVGAPRQAARSGRPVGASGGGALSGSRASSGPLPGVRMGHAAALRLVAIGDVTPTPGHGSRGRRVLRGCAWPVTCGPCDVAHVVWPGRAMMDGPGDLRGAGLGAGAARGCPAGAPVDVPGASRLAPGPLGRAGPGIPVPGSRGRPTLPHPGPTVWHASPAARAPAGLPVAARIPMLAGDSPDSQMPA